MATVETATVTLTVNGREVTVAKGLSLVEAAAEAGIEIPVFCYEPRLGAGVGACRMCLCEIEGMPKLQTACTTPAGDGMVVDSLSARAREGQDAVLEFLLLNHPLDCPVCDKGGECPLQDLTFRYGPGVTRMRIPKRTLEKPVPISPLIKLDRERCILCYRCTRFSEGVSGDMQLVPENRGAHSIITTFEGRPYANEFSGNVTELCPVGALTSTTYRFRARPWETQQIPSVCGLCAVGCNTAVNIREGHVVRVLSRNHPEIDEGWLCDKGRYAFGLLASEERITTGLIRGGRGLEQVAPDDALDHIADRLRATVERFGPGSVAVLASGEQTNEEAHAWARLLDEGLGGGISVCGPEGGAGWEALAPYAASIADIGTAGAVVVAGDIDLAHRAPVVELRIRKAVQAGARVVTVGAGGTRLETLRGAHHVSAGPGTAHVELLRAAGNDGELAAAVGDASTVVIWAGPMRPAIAAVLAHLAHARGWTVLRTPRDRKRARLPGGRPRVGHAGRGARGSRRGPHQGDRPARRRPRGGLAQRGAVARGPRAVVLRAPGDRDPERLERLGDHDRPGRDGARAGRHAHQPRGPNAARARRRDRAARRPRGVRPGRRGRRAAGRRAAA